MSTAALNIAVTVDSRTGVASLRQLGTQAQASGTQMETGFRQGGRSLTDFNGTLKTSVTALTGLFATIAGAAGIGSIIVSTAKMGAAFEYEMATVRGVMQASEEDFKDLSAAARLMGETTEWSAQQSAEALKYMGMTGWDAKTSIAALPGVLDLASAGGLELGRASEIATDSMTALQLGVEDLTRFTDVLTATTTNSSTSVSVMGETFKESAGTATVMGYSLEELSAMAGILASSAIKGSQAGNNLKNMMLDNAKAAAILGTENNDLIGTLKAAKAAQWDMVQISKIYGKENVAAVAALMENIDGYEELEGKLHNVAGATKSLAAIKLDTLTGDVKSLASEASELGLTMFDGFSDELRTSVQSLTGLLRDNKEVFAFLGEVAGGALDTINKGFQTVQISAKEFAAIINGD
ncbi:MAG: phage tail tape measure protein, partial [Kiritimatiellia bacterium]